MKLDVNSSKKTLTKSQLAGEYGISVSTFMNWIKVIPDLRLTPCQKILTPRQIKKIYEHLDMP